MERKLLFSLITCCFCCVSYADVRIGIVNYTKIIDDSKVGKDAKMKIKKLMDDVRRKFAVLEDILRDSKNKTINNSKSLGVVFGNKSEFDIKVYENSNEKDKYLMLHSFARRKSDEVAEIAAETRRLLERFAYRMIKRIARHKSVDIIVDSSSVLYKSDVVIDITSDVIKCMDSNCNEFKLPSRLNKK